jgi:hypothetical protein
VPTFHGAANDLMTLAGTTIDLLARRLAAASSGIDLFDPPALPRGYSGRRPGDGLPCGNAAARSKW